MSDVTVAALEERVRQGDKSISAADLAAARENERLAELRVEADQRAAEQSRTAERRRQLAELRGEVLDHPGNAARLTELCEAAAAALGELLDEWQSREMWLRDVARRARTLGAAQGDYPGDSVAVSQAGPDVTVRAAGRVLRSGNARALVERLLHDAVEGRDLAATHVFTFASHARVADQLAALERSR
jgi:hypothetical protein